VKLTKEEIRRKLLHLFALLMPVSLFYAPRFLVPAIVVTIVFGVLFFGSIAVELLRFNHPVIQKIFFALFGSMLRKEEHVRITGSTWVIGSGFLCSILFCKQPHIAFITLSLFIIGDAAAALVGIGIGKIRIGKKSLEGSLACFVTCLLLFKFLFPWLPWLLDGWGGKVPLSILFSTAFTITLFELIPLRITKKITINDNLAVPVIAGYVVMAIDTFFLH
jgi:dolichol kinase